MEVAVRKSRRAQAGGGGADRQQFGMGGGVMSASVRLPASASTAPSGPDDHAADRHLAARRGGAASLSARSIGST